MESKKLEGIGSIALLPSGSISGHFVHTETMRCLGIYGSEIPCERECSRGEDYRLIKLSILDYRTRKEVHTIVQCKGHDFARFHNVDDVHGWEEDLIKENKDAGGLEVSFQCEVLKSGKEADDHLARFLPALSNRDAVVNVGTMTIKGLDFEASTIQSDRGSNNNDDENQQQIQQRSAGPAEVKSEKDYDPDFDFNPGCPVVHVESLAQLQVGDATDSSMVVEGLLREELEAEGLSEAPVEFEYDNPCARWRLENQSKEASKVDSEVTQFDEEQGEEASS